MVQPNLEELLNQTQTQTLAELDLTFYISTLVALSAQQYGVNLSTLEGQAQGQQLAEQLGEIISPFYMASIDDLKQNGLEGKPGFNEFSQYINTNKTFYNVLESIIDDKSISVSEYQSKKREVIGNLFTLEDYMVHLETGVNAVYEIGKQNLMTLPGIQEQEIAQNLQGFEQVLSVYASMLISEAAQVYGLENVNKYLSSGKSSFSLESPNDSFDRVA